MDDIIKVVNDDCTALENALMNVMIDCRSAKLTSRDREVLRSQFAGAKVTDREYSGSGFFTRYAVADAAERLQASPKYLGDSDYRVDIDTLPEGIGFVLFLSDGAIRTLEGYSYDGPWPTEVTGFHLVPIPEQPRN